MEGGVTISSSNYYLSLGRHLVPHPRGGLRPASMSTMEGPTILLHHFQ